MNPKIRIAILLAAAIVLTAGLVFVPRPVSEMEKFDRAKERLGSGDKFARECIDGDFVSDPSQAVVEIDMSAYQWRFSYCSITVRQGQTIIINLKSLDVPHGMTFENMRGVNVFISPDTVSTVTFEAETKGNFTYFCTVFCGEGHPFHKGELIVE